MKIKITLLLLPFLIWVNTIYSLMDQLMQKISIILSITFKNQKKHPLLIIGSWKSIPMEVERLQTPIKQLSFVNFALYNPLLF